MSEDEILQLKARLIEYLQSRLVARSCGDDAMTDEPKLPEHELQKANELGREAGREGKPETACPYFLPALRAQWLGGWDTGQMDPK